MEILLVRGQVRPGSDVAFNEAAKRYNSARESAGLPAYRRMVDTTSNGEGGLVFMCEFNDPAEIERAESLLETDPALKQAVGAMYEHIVSGSVTAITLRDVE